MELVPFAQTFMGGEAPAIEMHKAFHMVAYSTGGFLRTEHKQGRMKTRTWPSERLSKPAGQASSRLRERQRTRGGPGAGRRRAASLALNCPKEPAWRNGASGTLGPELAVPVAWTEGSTTQIPSSQLQVHIQKRIQIYLPPATGQVQSKAFHHVI